MSNVTKGSDGSDARKRSENTKLSESIKTVTDEMSFEIQIANKSLSGSLTKQFREEKASLKEELSSKLRSEILNLNEAMNQLRKIQTLRLSDLVTVRKLSVKSWMIE
jgi:hypothetical protein